MADKLAYENRRAEFRERPPTHYCGRCTSVLYGEDLSCLECGAQPNPEWPELGPIADPWLGRVIGERYLLTRGIGAGASGSVYRAESLAISRQFALKIVPLDADDSTSNTEMIRARLNREIGALGQLRNPHIVSFYDVLPVGDDAVALLMDLIEGRTLQDVVWAAGSLELGRALKILRQIANGVHEAHEAQMIHRDLKPDNIMIERLPAGDDFVHILDFGIVYRLDDVRVTQGFLGTPLYASPEQAVGGAIDCRADIYALGAVTFFMLTGKPPFDDDNVYKVLKAHAGQEPPRLADVAPDRHFPEVIEALVARMLAKKPEDRPQSLAEVIQTLDRFGREHVSAEPTRERHIATLTDHSSQWSNAEVIAAESSAEMLNQTVQSEASLSKASSGSASVETASASAPAAAIFQRRKSDISVAPLPRREASTQQTQLGVQPRRLHSPVECTAKSDDTFALPEHWYGRQVPTRVGTRGYFRAEYKGRYWSILDAQGRLVVGEAEASDTDAYEIPDIPPITVMGQRAREVLTGHADGSVFRWNAQNPTGELLHQNAAQSAISAMVCNQTCFFFGTRSGGLYVGVFGEAPIQPIRIQSGPAVRVIAARGGRSSFAVARAHGFIDVYNASSPNTIVQRITPPEGVTQLAFSQDGYLLAAAFEDKKVILYNALSGAEIARSESMRHEPLFIRFDKNGRLVGECEVDGVFFGLDLQRHLFAQATS